MRARRVSFNEYMDAAMLRAKIDRWYATCRRGNGFQAGSWYGRIPRFRGLIVTSSSAAGCRLALRVALESWVLLGVRMGDKLPTVGGVTLAVPEAKGR